mmetsp:Transcript_68676/g.149475  ORF Transcript_68676/g.149475 Transcript_68676/m.149475 type:complete len:91 (+) Transcript_68676:160-432(+)
MARACGLAQGFHYCITGPSAPPAFLAVLKLTFSIVPFNVCVLAPGIHSGIEKPAAPPFLAVFRLTFSIVPSGICVPCRVAMAASADRASR